MAQERNFWRIKMYPDGDTAWGEKNVPWILENKGFIGMGIWGNFKKQTSSEAQNNAFVKEMKVGDIVGVMIYNRLLALVQVTDVAVELPNERIVNDDEDWYDRAFGETDRLNWMPLRRPVRVLDWNIGGLREPVPAGFGSTLAACRNLDAASNKAIVDWFNQVYESFELRGLAQMLD